MNKNTTSLLNRAIQQQQHSLKYTDLFLNDQWGHLYIFTTNLIQNLFYKSVTCWKLGILKQL